MRAAAGAGRVARAVVLALLAAVPCTILVHAFGINSWPYQLDREEGFLLWEAMELWAGRSIYQPTNAYPFSVGNYTPIFPALYAAAMLIIEPSLALGRWLVMGAALGAGAAGAWLVRRTGGGVVGWFPMLLAPLLYFNTWAVADWVRYARVDFLALLFSTCGLALLAGARARWQVAAAAVLFVLGVYTKQTQILAPLAGAIWLVAYRRWGDLAVYTATSVGLGGLMLVALQAATGGEFWRHAVTYNANVFHWDQVPIWLRHYWRFQAWLLLPAIGAAGLLVCSLHQRFSDHAGQLLVLVYTVLTLGNFIGLGKAGSAVNYLLEVHLAVGVLIAVGFHALANMPRGRMVAAATWVVFALLGIHACHHLAMPYLRRPLTMGDTLPQYRVAQDQLVLDLRDAHGDVLCEEPVYTILARKPVLHEPFIMAQLAREGQWDQSPLLADITAHRFAMIVTNNDLERDAVLPGWTEEMRAAILASHTLTATVPAYPGRAQYVYRPRW